MSATTFIAPTHQKSLYFLSENSRSILTEIIRKMPSFLAVIYLRKCQNHMWTEKGDVASIIGKLSDLTYRNLLELTMQIVEELRGLSLENYKMVIAYVHDNCDAIRTKFQLPKCFPQFFERVFGQCISVCNTREKKHQEEALRSSHGNNQTVQMQQMSMPMTPNSTNSYRQCDNNNQQNYYQSTSIAGQSLFVQTGPTLNYTSQNMQICPMNNTYVNGLSLNQTNAYQSKQPIQPIWQLNGNNEVLTYQPAYTTTPFDAQMHSNQLHVVSIQSQQPQFMLQNTNQMPSLQTQIGGCKQSATIPMGTQNLTNANQVIVGGQNEWPVQMPAFNSCNNSRVNTTQTQKQNTVQVTNTLPILRSTDVSEILENTLQQTTEMQKSRNVSVLNSNNPNCVNANPKILNKNVENTIQTQLNLIKNAKTNRFVHLNRNARLSLKVNSLPTSVRQPKLQTNTISTNIDRKRSAPTILMPQKKTITISSITALPQPVTGTLNGQLNENHLFQNIHKAVQVNTNEKINENEKSTSQMITPASIVSPTMIEKSATNTDTFQSNTVDNQLNEPNTSKAFANDAATNSNEKKSPVVEYEKIDDFEILVQTSTETKIATKYGKIEKCDSPQEDTNNCFIDLCKDSPDSDSDVVFVKTIDENELKSETNVSRFD